MAANALPSKLIDAESHGLERDVQRELLASDAHQFDSLVVRRISHNTVCLEGVVHVDDEEGEAIESVAKHVAGVKAVLNHLLVQPGTTARPTNRCEGS